MAQPANVIVPVEIDDPVMKRDLRYLRGVLVPFATAGMAAIFLYVLVVSSPWTAIARLGFALAVAGAAAASGALVGFIFGIPKTLASAEPKPAADQGQPQAAMAPEGDGNGVRVQNNTNLEQISDWLTKLLIGASLTQVGKIGGFVDGVATTLALEFGAPSAKPFFGAVVVFWAIHGFFVAYLLTRRVLPKMFDHSMREYAFAADARSAIDSFAADLQRGVRAGTVPDAVTAAEGLRMEEVADRDLATWGRAQLVLDRHDLAARAFQRVLERAPESRRVTEDLVFASLYLDPPKGFEAAIEKGEKVAKKSAAMLVYLAAAYGQKYRWLNEHSGQGSALDDAKQKAYQYAKQALEKDASWKPVLRGMLDPAPNVDDDDLVAFRGEEAFRKLFE